MALPSAASKANCDSSTDDPKLALLTDLAALIDKFNLLLSEVQPISARLTTLSGITTQQATDLAALSTFMGTVLNDASAAVALATLGAPLNAVDAKSAAYTVLAADRGKLIDYTSGSYTLSTDAAATLGAGFAFAVRNSGSGTITIDPNASEQIDGATTVSIAAGESCLVVCNGTAWKTVGRTVALPAATASVNGYMTSTYAAKLDGIAAGATVGFPKDAGVMGVGITVVAASSFAGTVASGDTVAGSSLQETTQSQILSGTYRNVGLGGVVNGTSGHFQRIA